MTDNDPLNISGQLVAEKYRIEHLVGEGGFAVVYLAEHTIWKQPVAIKFFSGLSQAPAESREELLQQFIQEGALLTELSSQSAGIVQARDVGVYTTPTGQWMPYMVLEWLDGVALDAVLHQDQSQGLPWTEDEVVGFLRRILPILDVAHRRGIAHRDIKPANIFVMGSAARATETPCKLLDFGVAKMVSEHAKVNAALAKTGMAITSFTPRYGAPEQFTRSHGATGPWTDVYSIALVASEMLAGKVALQGDDFIQYGFSSADPDRRPTPRALGAQISDQMEAVFAKALALRPADRFPNAGEFLEGVLAAAGPALPVTRPQSPQSSSIQLAPTVLIPTEHPPAPAPTTKPEPVSATLPEPVPTPKPAASPRKGGVFVTLLLLLIVFAGGTFIFSETDIKGASETRAFIAPVVQAVRKKAAQWIPSLRKGAKEAINRATSLPRPDPPPTTKRPHCPPGTQWVPIDQGDPTEVICVDKDPVSEAEYVACSTCAPPALPSPKEKRKAKTLSTFCLTGKNPTTRPIRCAEWKQAAVYCRDRAARLPADEELRTVPNASPQEWTLVPPSSGVTRLKPFRCIREIL